MPGSFWLKQTFRSPMVIDRNWVDSVEKLCLIHG
jgi:hypothetical protein